MRRSRARPHETRAISWKVAGGAAAASNSYPLGVTFDAGPDGRRSLAETLHVNVIAQKKIAVDGNLDDWQDVLPQPIRSGPAAGKNLTEKAWLPLVKFDANSGEGFASGYLAYDDQNFYFAAKIADAKPYEGNVRFANRDENADFYPETSLGIQADGKLQELHWPGGVRRFLVSPQSGGARGRGNRERAARVQRAAGRKDRLALASGRHDAQVHLLQDHRLRVRAEQGGRPVRRRHRAVAIAARHAAQAFYPRQPKVPAPGIDGGPVEGGQLFIARDGAVRRVECSLPWSEMPEVKKKLDAREPIKFTFRVSENNGPKYELNEERSVSKVDTYALHNYWQTSWAVETEFAFEP